MMPTASVNSGTTSRGLVPEDLLRFYWLDEMALAPDGQRVAYTVKHPDAAHNGYETHLYIRSLDAGRLGELNFGEQVTSGTGRATSLAWDRSGRRLAYVWSTEQGSTIEVIDATDTEAAGRSYPVSGAAFSSLDWSPDGTHLAGVRWTPAPAENAVERDPEIPAPSIKVIKRLRYKQDGVGWVQDRFLQIWVLGLVDSALVQVTSDECDYSEPVWSQSGDSLAFIGMAREQNIPLGQGQLFVCSYPAGTPRLLLPDWVGACRSPQWGEGDRLIAFAGHEHPAPTNRRFFMKPYLADVAAGTARNLAPEIDDEVGNYAVADQRKGLSNITVKWPQGDPWIYFLLTERGGTNLYRINTAGHYEQLVGGESVTFEYSPAAADRVIYGQADPLSPGELFLRTPEGTNQLTDLNPWLSDMHLIEPESYTYSGVGGVPVQAWMMRPPADKEGGPDRYPAIVYVHCSMFSWDFNHEFQALAHAGYVVAYFNQRGTTAGYGQAWTKASEGDQGGADYDEVMLGVTDLIARAAVDQKRMGVTGGSCGGFMTNWIIGHSDHFAAAVTQRSITNQISFFGNSDIGPECTIGETGATPWTDLQTVWQQSPIAFADRVNTPLLIIHSDEDYRTALEQAEQLFAVLRWMGKEVEMVIFEGESHGLSRGGRPANRIERQRRILGWFDKHLKR